MLKKDFSLEDINWELFTDEEKEKLTECYNEGDYHNLTCLPYVAIDTPAKEAEVDKMAISLRVTSLDSESEVRQELNDFWQDPANEMTPELEAEFQAKIDAELKEKQNAIDPAKEDDDKETESSSDSEQKEAENLNIEKVKEEAVKASVNK